jgi:hypothetical protein
MKTNTDTSRNTDEPISRIDLEDKFRQLQGGVSETAETAKSYALAAGAVVIVGVAVFAFFVGRRRGKKKTTVVEIRRV